MTEVIEVQSISDIPGVLDKVIKSVGAQFDKISFKPVLSDITNTLEERHAEYFAKEESPTGDRWQPWFFRPFDAQDDHPTLDISGTLKGSLLAGRTGHVERTGNKELEWGTNIDYAGSHNEGAMITTNIPMTSRGGVFFLPAGSEIELPQREFVGIDNKTVDGIAEAVADFTVEELKDE